MAPGMFLPICRALVCVIVTLSSVTASCHDVDTAVNCSFETSESCLDSYQVYDEHGLKWIAHTGPIQSLTMQHDRNYGYQRSTRVVTLQASPKGRYMYLPGTEDHRAIGLWTDLVSPPVTVDNSGCLYFFYHNNVCGTLFDPMVINFKIWLQSETLPDILLREYRCENTTQWYAAKIPISGVTGAYSFAFSGKQHTSVSQSIGVDHVIYTDQSCSIIDRDKYVRGDCDFEDAQYCGYRQAKNDGSSLRWLPIYKGMRPWGYDYANAPKGYFWTIWGKQLNETTEHVREHFTSPKITMQQEGCLSLTYYSGRYEIDNDNQTALEVSKFQHHNSSARERLFKFPATLGNEWMKAYITLPEGHYHLRFTARLKSPFGESPYDVIGLDDIEVHAKPCSTIRCDGVICEAKNVQMCNGRGVCIGRGLKNKYCKCNQPYIGNDCEFNPVANIRRRD